MGSEQEATKIIESRLQHEWTKRSPVLEDDDGLETMELVIEKVCRLKIHDLSVLFPSKSLNIRNKPPIKVDANLNSSYSTPYYRYVQPDEVILSDIIRHSKTPSKSTAFVRAGPREKLFFDPKRVRAGIVTCGGLCPGLNNVIRELVRTLYNLYDVEKVFGFVGGYGGIYTSEPQELTLHSVEGIHHAGGTILSSSRGGFDAEKIYNKLKELKISQFYLVGGDGTMRGAEKLSKYVLSKSEENNHYISIAGIPKTIDNDIDLVDRSFGFNTAVTEALRAIESAKVESQCVPNGIGVVKLMGRHAGFIATHAALASGDCDLCLIPEAPIQMEGPNNIFDHLLRKVKTNGHAVVVVAEGAGEEVLGKDAEVDAGGNRKLPAIGYWLKLKIREYFQSKGIEATVKYIDPSYMIRSVEANASDSLFCLLLAQNVVHGAMAGLTEFCVGLCNNRTCYLPISAITKHSPRQIDTRGRTYDRVLSLTGQPRHTEVPTKLLTQLSVTQKTVI